MEPTRPTIKRRTIKRIQREFRFYRAILRDPRVPRVSKWLIAAGIGYLFLPFDLIPDFIPLIGQIDDLIVTSLLIGLGLILVPRSVKADVRSRTRPIRIRNASPEFCELYETEALPSHFGVRLTPGDADSRAYTDEEIMHTLLGLVFKHRLIVLGKEFGRNVFDSRGSVSGNPLLLKPTPLTDCPNYLPNLIGVEVPSGERVVQLVDMESAYQALLPGFKMQLDGFRVRYRAKPAAAIDPPRRSLGRRSSERIHDLVTTHPITHHKIFSPLSEDCEIVCQASNRGADLLDELRTHTQRLEFCYLHRFESEDIIISDALTTLNPPIGEQRPNHCPMGSRYWSEDCPVSSSGLPGDRCRSYRVSLLPTAAGSFSAFRRPTPRPGRWH